MQSHIHNFNKKESTFMSKITCIRILVALLFTLSNPIFAQWEQTNGPYGGIVNSLAVSGTNLFAGTLRGGVFLSTNNGTSWTEVNTGLTYTAVYSLAVSGTNLFAGTWGGVFLSTNNGASWTEVNTGLTNTNVLSLAVSGTNLFAGTYGGGVFRRSLSDLIIKIKITQISDVTMEEDESKEVSTEINRENFKEIKLSIYSSNDVLLPVDSIKTTIIDNKLKMTITPKKRSSGESIVTIEVIEGNDTAKTQFKVLVNKSVPVREMEEKTQLIFPNPASEYIKINLNDVILSESKNPVKIYNTYGECVIDFTPTSLLTGEGLRIDVSHLPVGTYFIKYGNYTGKFVVVR